MRVFLNPGHAPCGCPDPGAVNSGTGLRSLLDTFVYISRKGEILDWAYITGEAEKLGIAEFEVKNRNLALHLFGGEELAEADREMLDYILNNTDVSTVLALSDLNVFIKLMKENDIFEQEEQ